MVPKRLERNLKLRDSLRAGYDGDKIPLEPSRVEPLFVFIAKGLLWHHWEIVLAANDCAAATVVHADGTDLLSYIFSRMNPRNRVDMNLGDGTLIYEGIQATDCAQFSLWRFLIYGGLCFAEESRDPHGKHSLIFAVTGPGALLPRFWASVFKEELQPAV
jgi:hypothetical protein